MKKIEINVYSHLSIQDEIEGIRVNRYPVNQICSSAPLNVHSYEELVEHIAKINYYNRQYSLFYRGQRRDYLDPNKLTTLYPSIYRNRLTGNKLKKNFEKLDYASRELFFILSLNRDRFELIGIKNLQRFRELTWAILQHYQICSTPVLDITHSLRVAASFSLVEDRENQRQEGILYVMGFPNINDYISYHVSDELVNVKLLSFCPPAAKRPFYQEGFVAGTFPHYDLMEKQSKFDFKNRLIAKFRLINDNHNFLGRGLDIIPFNSLYPNDHDNFYDILRPLKEDPYIAD